MLLNLTYQAWATSPRTIEGVGAWSSGTYTVVFGGEPVRIRGASLSPSIFRLLRTSALAGRFFTETEGAQGGERVVVLSEELWRERFGAEAGVLGTTLTIDGRPHLVVGVTPKGFAFPDREARLFTPYVVVPPGGEGALDVFFALARLRPGVTTAQAAAEGTAAARSQARPILANLFLGEGGPAEVQVRPLAEDMTASVRPALLVLMAGVLVLLLGACANVANLLLSQALSRRRELAVRAALGATRGRLLRLLLTHSLALAAVGGGLGALLAFGLLRALPAVAPDGFPRLDEVRLDPRVLAFGLVLSLLAGALAGLVPALEGSRRDLVPALRDAAGGATSGRGRHLRLGLLVGEAALCVVLLVGAGLLVRSFARLVHVDAG
jgi:predicted permease